MEILKSENSKKEQNTNRHVLIIGGAGYIGSVLARKLLSKSYQVRVLDNLLYDNGSSVSDLMEEELFSFFYGDFGNDEIFEKALNNVTDVVLLAALVGDPICKKYPDLAKKTNLDFPKNLLQKLIGKYINKFIFTSTCSNYGLRADDSLAVEDSELNPQSLYAETKVEFERYILDNLDKFDFSPAILRLATAFGMSNRMRFDLTISEFTKDLALGKELIVYDENTWRPYCNVSDISNAIIKVIEAPKEKVTGQVFNIGSENNNYTKKMILELIQKHLDNTKIEYKVGGFDPRNYRVSFDKVNNILDFKTHFTAEDSIKQIICAIENKLFADIEKNKNYYGNYAINE
ncbi:MAG: NAD(P)-dependent oxidoreductase [Ignavibacteria bacterium]|nr:NAD(P)-dependent oxidoreductase [Ignavibacteria bacterium]